MNEAQTLTLEAGKYYRTKDGRKAYVVGKHPFDKNPEVLPFCGFVDGERTSEAYWWDKKGTPGRGVPQTQLVAEWVEPKRIKGWVNAWMEGGSLRFGATLHATRAQALEHTEGQFACIEIDVLEGHGLGEVA